MLKPGQTKSFDMEMRWWECACGNKWLEVTEKKTRALKCPKCDNKTIKHKIVLEKEKIVENEDFVKPKIEEKYDYINFIEKRRTLDEILDEIEEKVLELWDRTGKTPGILRLRKSERCKLNKGLQTLKGVESFIEVQSILLDNGGTLVIVPVDDYTCIELGDAQKTIPYNPGKTSLTC